MTSPTASRPGGLAFVDTARLPALPGWLADDPGWPAKHTMACRNGIVNLASLASGPPEILPPTPSYFNRNALAFDFIYDAPSPEEWLQFLGQLWPKDEEM